jgi:ribokinase
MSGRVVVVGAVNVDLVVRGERLPGPGETVTGGAFERHHGGKGGNQAVAAARLGRPTLLVGAVGDDEFGDQARAALRAEQVDVSRLSRVRDRPTGVALILVDGAGENLISVASGANAALAPGSVSRALARLGSLAGDVVLVSREIPAPAVHEALRVGRAAGARTVLNPAPAAGMSVTELGLADVLTPNLGELVALAATVGLESAERVGRGGRDDPEQIARHLLDRARISEAVVVTLGARGALLVPVGGEAAVEVPGLAVTAVDGTGAGDTFNGALAAGLAEGRALVQAVRRAVVAAGLSTTVPGAREGMPRAADLERAIAERA